jgi:hypothetical protein
MDWGSGIWKNFIPNPGSRGSKRHRMPDPRSAILKVFGTDPNRIGLLGKPPAVKQILSYKSQ